MTQKAEDRYQGDYQTGTVRSGDANVWIWGGLAALAALAFIMWLMSSNIPTTGQITNSSQPATQQTAPAQDAAPAPAKPVEPVQPAQPQPAPPVQPAQPANP